MEVIVDLLWTKIYTVKMYVLFMQLNPPQNTQICDIFKMFLTEEKRNCQLVISGCQLSVVQPFWLVLGPCTAPLNPAVGVPCGAAVPEAFSQQARTGLSSANPIKFYYMGRDTLVCTAGSMGLVLLFLSFCIETWSGAAKGTSHKINPVQRAIIKH